MILRVFAFVLLSPAITWPTDQHRAAAETGPSISSKAEIPITFADVAKEAGLDFKQDSTASDQKYYLETMGTGLAWIDYNQDGLMDLFFVQSAPTDIYNPPIPYVVLSIATMAMGPSATLRKKLKSEARGITDRV